jgi:hypothetical protein
MILALRAAVRVVPVRKAARRVATRVVQAARRVVHPAAAHRVAAPLVVTDRKAVDRKAAAQAAVRLAARKDLAAHLLEFQCQAAAGFRVFRVLAPAVRPVAVVVSQAAARPTVAVELRAVHRMKASSEDRAAAVVRPVLLVVKRAARADKQVAVRPVVLPAKWVVAPRAGWRVVERPVVLLARWVAQAIQVPVCPAAPVNLAVQAKRAEVAGRPAVPADLPALVRATVAEALAVARVEQVR